MKDADGPEVLNVAELFAGVGGFRLGLERASRRFSTTFSSQWEPPGSAAKQFASRCYSHPDHFGNEGHSNEDISVVLERVARRQASFGRIDVVVGGFPCQDYSVAKPLSQAEGLVGKKGVLWWQIHRMLHLLARDGSQPRWLILENVDRLLKSPSGQRGRDFAVMLASLSDLGYDVEWRVINAADYGFPQKRRRVFIVARPTTSKSVNGTTRILRTGVLAKAFQVERSDAGEHIDLPQFELVGGLDEISRSFGRGVEKSAFMSAGYVSARKVWTCGPSPEFDGPNLTLASVLVADGEIDESYVIASSALPKWKYCKGAKNEPRVQKRSGFVYNYTEGALPFPDPIDRASRTILTSEGGASPSRSKHVIQMLDGRYRRLTPVELERLNGFPDDWTATGGMTDVQRAFCMGNALVVGLVERIARVIAKEEKLPLRRAQAALVSV